jgi:hypothetical protein
MEAAAATKRAGAAAEGCLACVIVRIVLLGFAVVQDGGLGIQLSCDVDTDAEEFGQSGNVTNISFFGNDGDCVLVIATNDCIIRESRYFGSIAAAANQR